MKRETSPNARQVQNGYYVPPHHQIQQERREPIIQQYPRQEVVIPNQQ